MKWFCTLGVVWSYLYSSLPLCKKWTVIIYYRVTGRLQESMCMMHVVSAQDMQWLLYSGDYLELFLLWHEKAPESLLVLLLGRGEERSQATQDKCAGTQATESRIQRGWVGRSFSIRGWVADEIVTEARSWGWTLNGAIKGYWFLRGQRSQVEKRVQPGKGGTIRVNPPERRLPPESGITFEPEEGATGSG